MRVRHITLLFLLALPLFIQAQSIQVVGKIVNAQDKKPVKGALVSDRKAGNRTFSNLSGEFTIRTEVGSTLTFDLFGMDPLTLSVDSDTIIVELQPKSNFLEEAIVLAYESIDRKNLTGSVSVLGSKQIERSQVSTITQALQGTMPGLQAIAYSGQPGVNAILRVRGIGSINASSDPLYVVDGVVNDLNMNTLNPADIESITVLKDASATLYGSRSANGVILITTKQGKKQQKTVVQSNVRYGVSLPATESYQKVNTDDYFKLYWEALRNTEIYINKKTPEEAATIASSSIVKKLGINPYGTKYPEPVGLDGNIVEGARPLWNDDWEKALRQPARRLEAQASVTGGTNTVSYFISGSYVDDEGTVLTSGFKRFGGRANVSVDATGWLTFNANAYMARTIADAPTTQGTSTLNAILYGRKMPGFYPIWVRNLTDGSLILDDNGNQQFDNGSYRGVDANRNSNLVRTLLNDTNNNTADHASARTSVNIRLMEGLTLTPSINFNYSNQNEHTFLSSTLADNQQGKEQVSKINSLASDFTTSNLLTYSKKIKGIHDIKLIVGQEYYQLSLKSLYVVRSGLIIPELQEPNVGSKLVDGNTTNDIYKLLSYLGQIRYTLADRYNFTASARSDASSRFYPDSRWGLFGSVGVSWIVTREAFVKEQRWLSNLIVRTSYGVQGNDNMMSSLYAYKNLYEMKSYLGEPGMVSSQILTKDLQWEENWSFNAGLDVGLLGRLNVGFDFFDRTSKNLLFDEPTAPSIGYTKLTKNVGTMRNRGIELSLQATLIDHKEVTWSMFANLTSFKNKIISIPGGEIISNPRRLAKGASIYDFFIPEWAGIDPKDGLPQWYKTVNGEREATKSYDEANTNESKIVAGTALPDCFGGFGTNVSVKGIEFSCLFSYSIGGKIYNSDKQALQHTGELTGRALTIDALNRWTPENTSASYPRMQTTRTGWTNVSSLFLTDATYARLKNITLGYRLPDRWLKKFSISQCKVFVQAENLLTFFGEQGLDPEQTINGLTNHYYPARKTISVGLSVEL